MLFQTCSIHCDVCMLFVSSSTMSGLLYCGWAEKNMTSSRDDRAIGVRWPDGDRTDICRSPSDYSSFIHTARSSCDDRTVARRRSTDFWQYFPKKNRTVARRSPPDVRTASRRSPADGEITPGIGRSSGKFNSELNLPDRRQMRAQGVLNRRMAARFLQDSSPGSPHGDRAIEFAQLWGSF